MTGTPPERPAKRRPARGRPARMAACPTTIDRAGLRERLSIGLAALGLEAAPVERLLDFLALIVKWNRVYNLTAIRDPLAMLRQHLLDSLSIARPLAARLPVGAYGRWRVVDVGSGAGLPGVVLALVWPQAEVLLVEPNGKKAAFLRQCQAELALANVTVSADRVESLVPGAGELPPDLIVCRALASLADFAAAIDRIAGPETLVVAMKGALPADELAELPLGWSAVEALPLRVPDLEVRRHLVVMRHRVASVARPPHDATGNPVWCRTAPETGLH